MRRFFLLLSAALWTCAAGCGITGTWERQSIYPREAQGDFRITRLTLQEDGGAVFVYAGDDRPYAGGYSFHDGELRLRCPGTNDDIHASVLLSDFDLHMQLMIETMFGPIEVNFLRKE